MKMTLVIVYLIQFMAALYCAYLIFKIFDLIFL